MYLFKLIFKGNSKLDLIYIRVSGVMTGYAGLMLGELSTQIVYYANINRPQTDEAFYQTCY